MTHPTMLGHRGSVASIVDFFMHTRNSVLLLFATLLLGTMAVVNTPREEEPQIVVPLADVYVYFPGADSSEVEKLVATPLEKLLWQIDGVEYVYSTSFRDFAIVTVRYFVGEDREDSLTKLFSKIQSNTDQIPSGVSSWFVKPVEVDDVPIVSLSLVSKKYNDSELHRMGEELLARLNSIENISRTGIIGGRKREIRLEIDPDRCASVKVTPLQIVQALKGSDASLTAGNIERANEEITISTGPFLINADDVRNLVVGVYGNRPVYLQDVGEVIDGPEEQKSYSRFGFGPASGVSAIERQDSIDSVSLWFAKQKGSNAVKVSRQVIKKAEELRNEILPPEVSLELTRDFGETANEKVNELFFELIIAIIAVVLLIGFGLGWREAMVVALSIPVSFALALFCSYLLGYTINRVTLFALVLSLGLVVDDPITNVDNIQRHLSIRAEGTSPRNAAILGVKEIFMPVLGATLAIIASFLPLFFISGMMGPYMEPMAANVPLTMLFSLICSITIVPWLAFLLLKKHVKPGQNRETGGASGFVYNFYRKILNPFLERKAMRWGLLGGVVVLLLLSGVLAVWVVPLKMLPFDNKNEFQIVVNMPEGTTLETTDRTVKAFERYLANLPEVNDYQSYVGINSPMDFNGLVRHYYIRQGSNLADIRINLAHKKKRTNQSHAIVLRVRDDLQQIADNMGADIQIVESPPGPPVISTITAELYGEADTPYSSLIEGAMVLKQAFRSENAVVDIDDSSVVGRPRLNYLLDKEKAALHGVTTAQVINTLYIAISGSKAAKVHAKNERNQLQVRVVVPRAMRSSPEDLCRIAVYGLNGSLVHLCEIGKFVEEPCDQPIYHKNLKPVVYVYAEMAGRSPVDAVLSLKQKVGSEDTAQFVLPKGIKVMWEGEGEWKITVDVFGDLGLAFAIAMLAIYIILVFEVKSFRMPLVVMSAIPLTAIGIMPGFVVINMITGSEVGGYENPIFFTATGMIGMIALGGIVVRNAILLIEFIVDAQKEGLPIKEALLRSGGVRFRPIMLTATSAAFGAWPITLDPIFSGLAWALIFGLIASTSFTLIVIPVLYYMFFSSEDSQEAEKTT